MRRPASASALALALLAVSLVVAAGAAVPSGAATTPRARTAKLQLDVAGYVETRMLHDTTSDCFPGETWVQTNTYTFETGNYVNVLLRNVSIPGRTRR